MGASFHSSCMVAMQRDFQGVAIPWRCSPSSRPSPNRWRTPNEKQVLQWQTFAFPQGPLDARAAHFVRHADCTASRRVRVGHGPAFVVYNEGPNKPGVHHDAREFPDGEIVLLTRLCEGQHATVLQLPASPRPVSAAEGQKGDSLVR